MGKIKNTMSLAKKVVSQAQKELEQEREQNLKARAKELLQDIQESKRTVALLEKQLNNFMRELDLDE